MNKIHNNLTIDNLIKTDWWIKQFNRKQRKVIKEGLKDNLDISWYAKKEYNAAQMFEIKVGLEKRLDVSIYAKPDYNEHQMKDILWVCRQINDFL